MRLGDWCGVVLLLALTSSLHAKSVVEGFNNIVKAVPEHCGRSRYNFLQSLQFLLNHVNKRIVGGQTSRQGEWPWLVTMQLKLNGTFEHLCGGTLIDRQWVLSAAHCFEPIWIDFLSNDPKDWRARIGEHHMFEQDTPHMDVPIVKIIRHPKRNPPRTVNLDIVLLKLAKPVELNPHVNVACLPAAEDDFKPGTVCITAGWGHTLEAGNVSNVVRHVELPVIANEDCNTLYAKMNQRYKFTIAEDQMCAGYDNGGKDACQYDSGGPMVCHKDNQWLLYGIVSTGYGCARAGFPGIYTRVNHFTNWIQDTIANN